MSLLLLNCVDLHINEEYNPVEDGVEQDLKAQGAIEEFDVPCISKSLWWSIYTYQPLVNLEAEARHILPRIGKLDHYLTIEKMNRSEYMIASITITILTTLESIAGIMVIWFYIVI